MPRESGKVCQQVARDSQIIACHVLQSLLRLAWMAKGEAGSRLVELEVRYPDITLRRRDCLDTGVLFERLGRFDHTRRRVSHVLCEVSNAV